MKKIVFRDFAPPEITGQFFFRAATFGTLQQSVDQANAWIQQNQLQVINVETVVLPEMHREEGTQDPALTDGGDMRTNWFQFVRVWYWSE